MYMYINVYSGSSGIGYDQYHRIQENRLLGYGQLPTQTTPVLMYVWWGTGPLHPRRTKKKHYREALQTKRRLRHPAAGHPAEIEKCICTHLDPPRAQDFR